VRTILMLCTHTVRTIPMLCTHTVRTIPMICTHTVRTIPIYCAHYTHGTLILCALYSYTLHAPPTALHTVHTLHTIQLARHGVDPLARRKIVAMVRAAVPMELVSPILQGEQDQQDLHRVLQALTNLHAATNNSTSVHVHIDCAVRSEEGSGADPLTYPHTRIPTHTHSHP
jgi:hypothetical protein